MSHATLTTLANEEWRAIKGYEGLYEVSNLGRVRSLDRYIDAISRYGTPMHRFCRGCILKESKHKKGYRFVRLCNSGDCKNQSIHRLVAQAFIPNPDNIPQVNHKDENKDNNRADNLEWCDALYNTNYGTGKYRKTEGYKIAVEQLTLDGQHVAYYDSLLAVIKANKSYSRGNLCRTLNTDYTSYGYRWRTIGTTTIKHANQSKKQVEQLTMDGKHVAFYPYAKYAAESMQCSVTNIYSALSGKSRHAKGYRWRYAEKQ